MFLDLCEALDWSDDEKNAELLPIAAQQIYVSLRLGKVDEAGVLLKQLSLKE